MIGHFIINLKTTLIFTTVATSGTGTCHPYGAPEFIRGFKWGSCCSIFKCLFNVLYIVVYPFSFGHCVVWPSSIYDSWLPLWYLQTFLYYIVLYYSDFNSIQYFIHSRHTDNVLLEAVEYTVCMQWISLESY